MYMTGKLPTELRTLNKVLAFGADLKGSQRRTRCLVVSNRKKPLRQLIAITG